MRAGLAALVESDPAFRVLALCASPLEWGQHTARVDVLLVAPLAALSDEWLQPIQRSLPQTPLLLLSQALTVLPVFGTRVWGLLPFTASSDEIHLAVRALSKGLWVAQPGLLPPNTLNRILPGPSAALPPGPLLESLTRRELEVLQCLALGFANKEIARQLEISTETVKFHIAAIYSKLGVNNRTEAVRAGLQHGLVNL